MNLRGIILREGGQGFVAINVALADELSIFWVNAAEISHLCVEACIS
jgi:hypothetical protein